MSVISFFNKDESFLRGLTFLFLRDLLISKNLLFLNVTDREVCLNFDSVRHILIDKFPHRYLIMTSNGYIVCYGNIGEIQNN